MRAPVMNSQFAALLCNQPPVPIGVKQQPVLQVTTGHQAKLPQFTMTDHCVGLLHHWVVALIETHGVHDTGPLGPMQEVLALLGRNRQRLLADHVFACIKDRCNLFMMQVVWCCDVHHLDFGVGQ
jgi:hypothetical protein